MATKPVKEYSAFFEGIADFPKTGGPASYQLGRSIDHRTDTRSVRLLPKTIKKSESVVTDLVKWITTVPQTPYYTYLYGNSGNIYLRDSTPTYSLIKQVENSHGNGLGWFGEDNNIYFTTDNDIGHFAVGSSTVFDNLFIGQGNTLVNTGVLSLLSASSQYTDTPSTSANSITGSITLNINAFCNATIGLNAVQTLISKWKSGGQKSYILQMIGVDADNFTARLIISNDGTTTETYDQNINITGYAQKWFRLAVTWDAPTSTAKFYINSLAGTVTHAMTSIFSSTTPLAIGADQGSGSYGNFFNGMVDNVSLWNRVLTVNELLTARLQELNGTESGLVAYYKFNFNYLDSSSNNSTMTAYGSPTFVSTYDQQNVLLTPLGLNPGAYTTTRQDIDLTQNLSGQTYTIPTTISETSVNKLPFTPTKDPQKSMSFKIAALGTGNLTLTIEDSTDTTIATKTYAAGIITTTSYIEFVFDTPWTPKINTAYHAHLTSSVADTTIVTGTVSDLSTAWYTTYFSFLTTDTQYHPIATMLQMLVVGNGNYLATLQNGVYDPNAIKFPFGWKVRCLGYWNEYLAIGAWMGNTVDQFDRGRIFFWDGVALTYNFYIDIPEGTVNSMVGSKGQLWFIAGSRCKLMLYEGGARAVKIKNLVNSENGNVIDIFPGAMSMWRLLLRFGVAGSSADTTIQEGVYTWGTVNERYPESLSFDYVVSTGTYQGTGLKIGAVQSALNKLLIGWQDGSTYGVDEVAVTNDAYASGTIQFLIEDDGAVYHQKEAITVTTQFEPLISGQSLTLKYRLDRAAAFTTLPTVSTVGATTNRNVIAIGNKRYREYEIGIDLATSVPTSPIVLGVSLERDILPSEKRVG